MRSCVLVRINTPDRIARVPSRNLAANRSSQTRARLDIQSRAHGTAHALPASMDILTLLVVGLVAGVLAGAVFGGYGLIADILIGMAGAYVGGYVFQRAHWHAPLSGLPGTIFVAFVGAAILLAALHLLHWSSHPRGGR